MDAARLQALVPALRGEDSAEARRAWDLIEKEIKYEGYLEKQQVLVERARAMEEAVLPETIDYTRVPSLRHEAVQVLSRFRPATLGAASRLAGVNPSDVAILMLELHRARGRSQ
jgi:tRNA uridine 5-carboxymethylaminomethyl modification enzyme